MGEQKEEDLYRNFSRKDLQGLCKKYGLPANKSNSEMATSLILYLENKNLSSIWEVTRSNPFSSRTSELQAGVRMNLIDDQRKGCRGTASHSGSGNNQCSNHQDAQQNDVQNCKSPATPDKAYEELGTLTQLHRESNSGASVPENAFSSVVSSPVVAPSPTFMFDVSCEDGIQLYIDLNSSSSDWVDSMKAGVGIYHNVHELKLQSFHQELGRLCSKQINASAFMDSSKETNNGQLEDGSFQTTIFTGVKTQADEPDVGEGSLSSPGLKSLSTAVHSVDNLGEEQATFSSRLEPDTEEQHYVSKSGSRGEETVTFDSDVNVATHTRMCHNCIGNAPCDPKYLGMSEHQGVNAGDGIYEKPTLQQTYYPLDPLVQCSESSAVTCMKMQTSCSATMNQDMISSPSKDDRCLDLTDQPQNSEALQCGLIKSIQSHEDVHQMQPVQEIDLTDHRCDVDVEHDRASILAKSSSQSSEAQTPLVASHRKSISFSLYQRHESLDVNITNIIETENDGLLSSLKADQEAPELQKNNAALYSCSNGVSLDLVVLNQNGVNHCNSVQTNELEEGRSQPTTNMGNSGSSKAGDGKESSEDLIERPCRKPVDSEFNGELGRKRHFNFIEDQTKSVKAGSESNGEPTKRHVNGVENQRKSANPEAKVLRTSKHVAGDVHASCRRSSRLFPK